MVYAAAFSAKHPDVPSRAIMSKWSYRLLDMLRHLARVSHLSNSGVQYAIATAMVERGDQYCCGNPKIAHQLRHYVQQERAKREGATMPVEVNFIASAGIELLSHFFSVFQFAIGRISLRISLVHHKQMNLRPRQQDWTGHPR